jgi:hypothetical protein
MFLNNGIHWYFQVQKYPSSAFASCLHIKNKYVMKSIMYVCTMLTTMRNTPNRTFDLRPVQPNTLLVRTAFLQVGPIWRKICFPYFSRTSAVLYKKRIFVKSVSFRSKYRAKEKNCEMTSKQGLGSPLIAVFIPTLTRTIFSRRKKVVSVLAKLMTSKQLFLAGSIFSI